MSAPPDIAVLDTVTDAQVGELADVLVDCVAGGASVSFMAPFGPPAAAAYFRKVAGEVERRETMLVVARSNNRIVGTVQLGVAMPPNQPHRADVKKLLVQRAARGRGTGAALMAAVEAAARRDSRTLLVLDTAQGGDAMTEPNQLALYPPVSPGGLSAAIRMTMLVIAAAVGGRPGRRRAV